VTFTDPGTYLVNIGDAKVKHYSTLVIGSKSWIVLDYFGKHVSARSGHERRTFVLTDDPKAPRATVK